jgi:hypothetical protein
MSTKNPDRHAVRGDFAAPCRLIGFHRVLAARQAGLGELPAEVRSGNQGDALLYCMSANAGHGLPRSNADKRKAVALLLADPPWNTWNDHEIARHCRVSCRLVGTVQQGASVNRSQIAPRQARRGAFISKPS